MALKNKTTAGTVQPSDPPLRSGLRSMVYELVETLKTRTARGSFLVLAGNGFGAILAFAFTALAARSLGPSDYGLFSVATAVMLVVANLMDFGINTAMVRYAASPSVKSRDAIFRAALFCKLGLALVVAVPAFAFSRVLAVHAFHDTNLVPLIRISLVGAFGISMMGFATSMAQTRERFGSLSMVNVANSFTRLALFSLLVMTGILTLPRGFSVILVAPAAAFLVGILLLPKSFLALGTSTRELILLGRKILKLGTWITVCGIFGLFFLRLDTMMLKYFTTAEETGIYSAGWMLAYSPTALVTGAIGTVIVPYLTKRDANHSLLFGELLRITRYSILLGVVFTASLLGAGNIVIRSLLAESYLPSIPVMLLLSGMMVAAFAGIGMGYCCYVIEKYRIPLFVSLVQLLGSFLLNWALIPKYGSSGAAVAASINGIAGVTLIAFLLVREGLSKRLLTNCFWLAGGYMCVLLVFAAAGFWT